MGAPKVHLQEEGIVQDDLGCGDAEVKDAVIDCARGFQRAQRLLQIAVHCPQLQAAVQPPLHWALALRFSSLRNQEAANFCSTTLSNCIFLLFETNPTAFR